MALKLNRAQRLAEAFAKSKAEKFFRNFLSDSALGITLYDGYKLYQNSLPATEQDLPRASFEHFVNLIVKSHEPNFGRWLALSYALGHVDAQTKTKMSHTFEPKESSLIDSKGNVLMMPDTEIKEES